MSRSIWKGPFSCVPGQPNINKLKEKQQVWSRVSMIMPEHISKEMRVHNGKGWVSLKVVEEMVGHKFGEFSSTRKKATHKLQKKKQSSRKKTPL